MTGLIIAGFHRSGTSMVGQILASHGFPLGGELIAANEFNPFGHFEDWPVVQFHDTVLDRVGADWSKTLAKQIVFTEEERRWILGYVKDREEASADWALKDPRMCRFVRQWKELVPGLKFIIIYRSPSESSLSLNRRSSITIARSDDTDEIARRFYDDPDLALRLWVEHNRELLHLYRSSPEDCLVLGQHHLLAGYDLMGAISSKFGVAPKFAPSESTIQPEVVSEKMSSLNCTDANLIETAIDLWNDLEKLDIAVGEGWKTKDVRASLSLDPEGQQARTAMLAMQVPEFRQKIALLQDEKAEQQSRIAEQQSRVDEQQSLIAQQGNQISEQKKRMEAQESRANQQEAEMAQLGSQLERLQILARKASKPPFSFYFLKRAKYREVIELILLKK